ncbi:hypothetical protein GCM10016272_21290 [Psychrobacter glaciei]|uniref:Pentapeptide repeat-containing protein n=1 Tax=Psychrobacter glaciei TaxID=619771 RepID=A0ABQ3GU54_9GAMM|nr:hypothetical protein [Psychrobacter glaciei]GHD35321.1 hypothetical protein GCM10016272_21290 [Psychrobacter glaciei]
MKCKLPSGCKNDIFRELDYCVLHCSDEGVEKKDIDNYLEEFANVFMEYLYENILKNTFYKVNKDGVAIRNYSIHEFKHKNIILNNELKERMGEVSIIVKNIVFPRNSGLEDLMLNIKTIIRYLGSVNFEECQFGYLSFNGFYNCYHKNCNFNDDLLIYPFSQVVDKNNENIIKYRYVGCKFKENVRLTPSIFSNDIYCNMFANCNFKKDVFIINLTIHKNLFLFPDPLKDSDIKSVNIYFEEFKNSYDINSIHIENCIFKSDFKINGLDKRYIDNLRFYGCTFKENIQNINIIKIIDTKFESKVEIKYRNIEDFKFINSNVDKIFDSFKSRFKKIDFNKSVFNSFAGFEEVVCGLSVDDKDLTEEEKSLFKSPESTRLSYLTVFEHVTFMDFSSFRGANFNSGLDFSKNNLKDKPNFLGVKINSLNTKRETFRIVKSSFDDAGNQIEANKFFIEEMKAYRKELKVNRGSLFERFILFSNRWISDFGGNYVLPIVWLVASIVIYTAIIYWHHSFFTEAKNTYLWHSNFDYVSIRANDFAKNFLPFSRFLTGKSGIEFVSLLFYIWFAVLIWQTIVAVKRHTQR